ncbi:hypothetical protein Q3G72_005436 [Acer saccharum]|nr:hypothetical protein Q3G72_005436 [Acer saccharum]
MISLDDITEKVEFLDLASRPFHQYINSLMEFQRLFQTLLPNYPNTTLSRSTVEFQPSSSASINIIVSVATSIGCRRRCRLSSPSNSAVSFGDCHTSLLLSSSTRHCQLNVAVVGRPPVIVVVVSKQFLLHFFFFNVSFVEHHALFVKRLRWLRQRVATSTSRRLHLHLRRNVNSTPASSLAVFSFGRS